MATVMSNMLINCVNDKLCYRQKCTLAFYLYYVCKIGLTLHRQVVPFSRLFWFFPAPIVVVSIRLLAHNLPPAITKYGSHLHSRNILQPPTGPNQYSQVILSAGVERLHTRGLILRARPLLCAATLKVHYKYDALRDRTSSVICNRTFTVAAPHFL